MFIRIDQRGKRDWRLDRGIEPQADFARGSTSPGESRSPRRVRRRRSGERRNPSPWQSAAGRRPARWMRQEIRLPRAPVPMRRERRNACRARRARPACRSPRRRTTLPGQLPRRSQITRVPGTCRASVVRSISVPIAECPAPSTATVLPAKRARSFPGHPACRTKSALAPRAHRWPEVRWRLPGWVIARCRTRQ